MKNICHLVLRTMCVCVLGTVLAACSSGSADSSRAGATVGGKNSDFSGDIKYVTNGDRYDLELENIHNHQESWILAYIKPEVGSYHCGDSTAITLNSPHQPAGSSIFGGDCVIQVTKANNDRFAGVFSGTIVASDEPEAKRYKVTDGSFDVLFVNVIPDADEDGLSDANDNCPFISNVDQADDNDDGIGDACTPEEEEESSVPGAPFPLSVITGQL